MLRPLAAALLALLLAACAHAPHRPWPPRAGWSAPNIPYRTPHTGKVAT